MSIFHARDIVLSLSKEAVPRIELICVRNADRDVMERTSTLTAVIDLSVEKVDNGRPIPDSVPLLLNEGKSKRFQDARCDVDIRRK